MSILRPSILMDFANAQMLDPRASFARASGGAVQDFSGTWRELLADYLRFGNDQTTGERLGLLVESQRVNLLRNPRAEGASAGSPGTLPTNWSSSTTSNGLSRSVVGYETINGVSCVLVRFQGTATATAAFPVLAEAAAVINGTVGQVFAISAFVRMTNAGAAPTLRFNVREVPSNTDYSQVIAAGATGQRFAATHTVVDAANTSIRPGISLGFASGQVIDSTVAVGLFQCELAPFASSPILPAVGSPASATRVADTLTLPLSAAGIGAAGACTIFGEYLLPQQCPQGVNQVLLSIDDGTANNRYRLLNSNSTAQIRAARSLAGANLEATVGTMIPGVAFRAALRIDGAGNIAASFNGGAVATVAGGPTAGLSTLRIGHSEAGTNQANGFIKRVGIIPRVVSDAALQLLSA